MAYEGLRDFIKAIINNLFNFLISFSNHSDIEGFDRGALLAAFVTFLFFCFLCRSKLLKDVFGSIRDQKAIKQITLYPLIVIIIISSLFTIRLILYTIFKFLFLGFYGLEPISIMIGWILTTNLTITLFDTFAPKEQDGVKYSHSEDGDHIVFKGMIDTCIKSIIIGIITYLPHKDDNSSVFTFTLFGLVFSLAALLYLKKKFFKDKSQSVSE